MQNVSDILVSRNKSRILEGLCFVNGLHLCTEKIQEGDISQLISLGGGVKSNFLFSSIKFLVFSSKRKCIV